MDPGKNARDPAAIGPGPAARLLLLAWLVANPLLFFLVAVSPSMNIAAFLPAFVLELHELLLPYFTSRSVY